MMSSPGGKSALTADSDLGPCGHERTDSYSTLVDRAAIYGLRYSGRARDSSASDDVDGDHDAKRFRVTAGTPAGPTAATTTANTGSSTAAAPKHIQTFTAAALAVADQPIAAAAGPDEGPSGGNVAGAATSVADTNSYEDSSDDEFDYENAVCAPEGCIMVRVEAPSPEDYIDEEGLRWAAVRIDSVPACAAIQNVDEDVAAQPLLPDDHKPVPRAAKRERVDDDDDADEPAPRAPKKVRCGKALDVDRLAIGAWVIGVRGACAGLTDGRRDVLGNANDAGGHAQGDAGVDVDVDGQNNPLNDGEAGAADEHDGEAAVPGEYDEEADWVLQV